MPRKPDVRSYDITRLNWSGDKSWAVIGLPGGAIVLDEVGRLVMKLEKAAAQALADRYNHQLSRGETPLEASGTRVAAPTRRSFN